jgi:hypothetical protein
MSDAVAKDFVMNFTDFINKTAQFGAEKGRSASVIHNRNV